MARLRQAPRSTGHRIAVVDDDPDLLASVIQLLVAEGHDVRSAATPEDAVALARSWRPDLMLLDYYMPGGTGAGVVRAVREFDSLVQVLLVTGYAADQPARKLLAELDIQGYHDKGDGPERLLVLVDAALKHRRALDRMVRQRENLQHLLEISPELSRLQPVRDLLRVAIGSVGKLLNGGSGFIATANNGLFLIDDACEGVSIHAATGRFESCAAMAMLTNEVRAVALAGLEATEPGAHPNGYIFIPLRTRDGARGCMVVQALSMPQDSIEPCKLLANQVVQALENVALYERATIDVLTGLYNRGFGCQRLEEVLRLGDRAANESSVAMIDVDHFKRLNDTYGHSAGDLALRTIARAVRAACRTTDVVVRYGGEELFVILPATNGSGAAVAAEKIRAAIAALQIPFDEHLITVTASIGVATSHGTDAASLLRRADEALYQAKRLGRDRVCAAEAESVERAA